MQPDTQNNQNSIGGSYLWLAGAVGAAAGIAAIAYSRRRETPWEKARRRTIEFAGDVADRAGDVAEVARKEVKPWMGVAAGAAVTGAGLAYKLRSKPTGWDVARKRAAKVAEGCNDAVQPWMSLAASAALGAASLARSRRKQTQTADSIKESVSEAADKLAETGARLFRRVQHLSGETRKLYPSVRRLIA